MAEQRHFIREWRERARPKISQEAFAQLITDAAQDFPRSQDRKSPWSWGRTDVSKIETFKRGYEEAFIVAAAAVLQAAGLDCGVPDLVGRHPDAAALPAEEARAIEAAAASLDKEKRKRLLRYAEFLQGE